MSSCLLDDLISTPGDIPLHIIAREAPSCLQAYLSGVPSAEVLASLRQRDAQGRTPSHWLWAPDGLLVQQAAAANAAQGGDRATEHDAAKVWIGTVHQVWEVQELLHKLGAGMDIPDNDGVTAMQMCQTRLDAEDAILSLRHDVCRMVAAHQSKLALSSSTTRAATPSPTPRL